jgi:predicted nucleotide-binding protein
MALIAGAAQPGQQKSASGVSTQQKTGNTQIAQQNDTATDSELARQLAEESAKLLKMAADLKAEVDKTNQDSISLAVIRKADAIEKLARNVKKEMKRTKGAS